MYVDDGVHGRGQTGSMDISNRTSGDSCKDNVTVASFRSKILKIFPFLVAVNEPTPRTSTPKPNRNLQLSLTAGKRNGRAI